MQNPGDVLKTLKDTNTDAYADVTIHVGINDCATKFLVDKIADNIREISNHAKRVSRSGCVTFSSITPRIDNVAAAEKGITLNEQMKAIAEETGCLFVNNQDNFLCRMVIWMRSSCRSMGYTYLSSELNVSSAT